MSKLQTEIERRRTFAIISHPDAGKTTLTEKLLLYGGAIHLAGAVRAKANQRNTTSDWMEIEKQRGISISTSVLQFEYKNHQINLLDTPGHKDFSEDTYRTLMATDAAVMLIDAAKGVEPQTRKLFEVCRMRGIPIFTFINKMDRPTRDPLDLLDELEKILGIRSCPMSWPIGTGDRFRGVYDRTTNDVLLFQTDGVANQTKALASLRFQSVQDPELVKILGGPRKDEDEARELHSTFLEQMELLDVAGDGFDMDRIQRGLLTPVFFGSAMNNFGVQHFLDKLIELAPKPAPRETDQGEEIEPDDKRFSGFVFKIQANMDPAHRDRVAFLRIISGKFERNMGVTHQRLKESVKLSKPLHFFAQERVIIDEAWPGDIVGLLDTSGELRIGDTLAQWNKGEFTGVPKFSPEFFTVAILKDPMKRKQFQKGVEQLSEEGVVQVYRQPGFGDRDPILGAVGALQFEVFQHRLLSEYKVEIKMERLPFTCARWVTMASGAAGAGGVGDKAGTTVNGVFNPLDFEGREDSKLVEDGDQSPVLLFKSDWAVRWTMENYPRYEFHPTAQLKRR